MGMVLETDFTILLLINLATFWYTALKIKEGSNTWLSILDICCLWNPPCCRKMENSWGFLIMMSSVLFALDLNDMGLPLTDNNWLLLFVVRPSSEKSWGVFCLNESSWLFWCLLTLVLVLLISSITLSRDGLFSLGAFMSSLESLLRTCSTDCLEKKLLWSSVS